MKTLELVRYGLGWDSTLGKLYLDGVFQCYVLEDEYREVKVYGETCIPEGTYSLILRHDGRLDAKYKALYPDMHKGMVFLVSVPQFDGIAIHRGVSDKDTFGCLLLGDGGVVNRLGEFELTNSARAYERVYPKIADAIANGGLKITVRRRP